MRKLGSTTVFVLGQTLIVTSLMLAISAAIGGSTSMAMLLALGAVSLALGVGIRLTTKVPVRPGNAGIYSAILVSWLTLIVVGAATHLSVGATSNWTSAVFESTAAFTTTAASSLRDLSSLPNGLIFFRSASQWIGAALTIGLAIALVDFAQDRQVFTKTRAIESLRSVGAIYALGTVAVGVGYLATGLPIFDAVCYALTTVSNGGFVTNTELLNSQRVQIVSVVGMLFGAGSFLLFGSVIRGRFRSVISSIELRVFALLLIGITAVAIALDLGSASRLATIFAVVSISTTTGFAPPDLSRFAAPLTTLLLAAMFVGGMSASASGGISVKRVLVAAKSALREVHRRRHPNLVAHVRLGRNVIAEDAVSATIGSLIAYLALIFIAAVILSFEHFELVDVMWSSVSLASNTGLALSTAGGAYESVTDVTRLALSSVMLAGRLELITLIVGFAGLSRAAGNIRRTGTSDFREARSVPRRGSRRTRRSARSSS